MMENNAYKIYCTVYEHHKKVGYSPEESMKKALQAFKEVLRVKLLYEQGICEIDLSNNQITLS